MDTFKIEATPTAESPYTVAVSVQEFWPPVWTELASFKAGAGWSENIATAIAAIMDAHGAGVSIQVELTDTARSQAMAFERSLVDKQVADYLEMMFLTFHADGWNGNEGCWSLEHGNAESTATALRLEAAGLVERYTVRPRRHSVITGREIEPWPAQTRFRLTVAGLALAEARYTCNEDGEVVKRSEKSTATA